MLPDLPPTTLVAVPGGPLAVHDVPGPPGARPALLVPGFTGSKEDFRDLLAVLATERRVVTLDQRGQYESPGLDDPAAHSIGALAGDVLAVIRELDLGPVHLVGHSFGGLVCRQATLVDPDAMASLTLLCSGPSALTGPRVELFPFLEPLLEAGGLQAVADALDSVAAAAPPPPFPVPPEVEAFRRERLLRNSVVALRAMAAELTAAEDRTAELAALVETGLPVLVAHGADDDAWRPEVQASMAARMTARYAVIPGAAHSPAVEQPAATAALLAEFWRASEPA